MGEGVERSETDEVVKKQWNLEKQTINEPHKINKTNYHNQIQILNFAYYSPLLIIYFNKYLRIGRKYEKIQRSRDSKRLVRQ